MKAQPKEKNWERPRPPSRVQRAPKAPSGAQITAIRQDLGMTQQQFSALVGLASSTCVCRWERCSARPYGIQLALLQSLAKAARNYADTGDALKRALMTRGQLYAIHQMLDLAHGDEWKAMRRRTA